LIKSMDGGNTWRRLTTQPTRWIAFDPARPNRIFVATDEAGLFRSDDAGESLQPINEGFINRRFTALAIAENALYVTILTPQGSSILRRSDLEPEWDELFGLAPQAIEPAMVPLANPVNGTLQPIPDDFWLHDAVTTQGAELLAATSRGLARSQDAGLTWQLVPGAFDGTTVSALCGHPARRGVFFASLFGGVFRSLDYGRTWTSVTTSTEHPNDFITLLVLPGHPDSLFALSRSRGVYVMALSME
jgi:photosystem II stability/assembly factor-like uncharacterized protein